MMKLPLCDMLPCGICEFKKIIALIDCRAKSRIPHNAESVITYLFPYYLGEDFYKNSNISKYAVPEDYHKIAGAYLFRITERLKTQHPQNRFEWFCDNSPVPEVETAVLCGLGVKGKNGLLINDRYGSFCFIGEIITDAKLPCSLPEDRTCLSCGACEGACPGNALSNYRVDASKCVSDITQRKGELDEAQRRLIADSGCVWGCDICQDVCPMNKNIEITPVKEFFDTAKALYESGDDISQRAFNWRGKAVIERNLKILL